MRKASLPSEWPSHHFRPIFMAKAKWWCLFFFRPSQNIRPSVSKYTGSHDPGMFKNGFASFKIKWNRSESNLERGERSYHAIWMNCSPSFCSSQVELFFWRSVFPTKRSFSNLIQLEPLSLIEKLEGVFSLSHSVCHGENNEKNRQSKDRCWKCAEPFIKIEWFWLVYLSEPLFCNGLLKIQVRVREKIPETKVS